MLDNNEQNEREVLPGENMDDLIITIQVNQYGEAQLGVNRSAVPVEVLYFYLQFMSNALIARHQAQMAEAHVERNRLVVPQNNLVVPR